MTCLSARLSRERGRLNAEEDEEEEEEEEEEAAPPGGSEDSPQHCNGVGDDTGSDTSSYSQSSRITTVTHADTHTHTHSLPFSHQRDYGETEGMRVLTGRRDESQLPLQH